MLKYLVKSFILHIFANMSIKNISINEVVLADYSKSDYKVIYIYAVSSAILAGYGYSSLVDYVDSVSNFTGLSKKTAKRWITKLKDAKLIKIRRGMLYIKGRKKLERVHDTTQTYIKFSMEDLKSYSNFRNHSIRQFALLKQKRFSYAIKFLNSENPASLEQTGKIKTALAVVKDKKRTGCSISKLQECLGFDKKTIVEALVGYTTKQHNMTPPINGVVARKRFKGMLDEAAGALNETVRGPKGNPMRTSKRTGDFRWGFIYNGKKDTYRLTYSIASRINVDSSLCRKK